MVVKPVSTGISHSARQLFIKQKIPLSEKEVAKTEVNVIYTEENEPFEREVEKMLYISFIWIMAGLMVLYHLNIKEVIGLIQLEADMGDNAGTEADNRATLVLSLFMTVLMWPVVLVECRQSR